MDNFAAIILHWLGSLFANFSIIFLFRLDEKQVYQWCRKYRGTPPSIWKMTQIRLNYWQDFKRITSSTKGTVPWEFVERWIKIYYRRWISQPQLSRWMMCWRGSSSSSTGNQASAVFLTCQLFSKLSTCRQLAAILSHTFFTSLDFGYQLFSCIY